jgi:hypothetical protein
MTTWAKPNESAAALRRENARRAARALGLLPAAQGANVASGVDADLARWEALRTPFANRLRLSWEVDCAAGPLGVFGHAAAPTPFVRLVYCLGYGERDLVQGRVQPNFGTPQFWKLLAAGVDPGLSAQVVERTQPDL